MNDDSMPAPDEAPVSRRTRLSLAMAALLSSAPGTTQGTVEGPLTWADTTRRVRFADEAEWDDEYDTNTDESERDRSEYVLFDDEDDDGDRVLMMMTRRSETAKAATTTRLASTVLFPRRCIFVAGPRSPERVGA